MPDKCVINNNIGPDINVISDSFNICMLTLAPTWLKIYLDEIEII